MVFSRSMPIFRHHSQKEIERNREYSIFEYLIRPTYDFRQEILSHGAEMEVLSPKWLREQISRILETQIKAYRTNK